MIDYSKIVVVMARQRSGTQMFLNALNSHPQVKAYGEFVFNKRFKTRKEIDKALERYVQKGYVSIFDVKYNFITPAVKKFLEQVKVIRLDREDVEAQYKSDVESRMLIRKIRDPNLKLISFEDWVKKGNEYVEKFYDLADFVVTYEELTNNKNVVEVPEKIGEEVCNFIGIKPCKLVTERVKGDNRELEKWNARQEKKKLNPEKRLI